MNKIESYSPFPALGYVLNKVCGLRAGLVQRGKSVSLLFMFGVHIMG